MPNPIFSPLSKDSVPVEEASISGGALAAEWRRQIGVSPSPGFDDDVLFRLWRCPVSQLRFFTPTASGDGQFYAAMRGTPGYYQSEKWEHRRALALVRGGDRLLDVGCGDGAFLQMCAKRGALAEGLEMNPAAIAHARKAGLEVSDSSVEALVAKRRTFDVVCAFQVLEHVEAPAIFLASLVELLKPGGRLIIGVPNGDGWVADSGSVYQWPPHHLTWWGRASLAYLPRFLPLVLEGIEQERLKDAQRRARVIALLDPAPVPGRRSGGVWGKIRRRLLGGPVLALSAASNPDGETLLAVYSRHP